MQTSSSIDTNRHHAAGPRVQPSPAPAPAVRIDGTYSDPQAIARVLDQAATAYNLVGPIVYVGNLPEGFVVVFTTIMLDQRDISNGGDLYSLGGGSRALSKTVLDRIASAAGVSWDPILTCRVDNGAHPFYCEYQAVGHCRQFDGRITTLKASRSIDLREGSPEVEDIRLNSEREDRGEGAIRHLRKFILTHAESKAKNRAVRCLGVRPSYKPAELARPFVVTNLLFNGNSADPDLKREFALMQARAAIGGAQALYGHDASPGMGRMAMPSRPEGRPPPPVGSASSYDDDEPSDRSPPQSTTETAPIASQNAAAPPPERAAAPPPERAAAPPPERAAAPPPQQSARGNSNSTAREWTVPFGKNKGLRLSQLSDRQIEGYCELYADSIKNPAKAQYRKPNEYTYTLLCDELERRQAEYERQSTAQSDLPFNDQGSHPEVDDLPF